MKTLASIAQFAQAQGQDCIDGLCDTGLPAVNAGGSQIRTILSFVFAIVGVMALIYLIIAGFRLTTSLGNPEALKDARQSVIFAAVGLAVALGAEIIINVVLARL